MTTMVETWTSEQWRQHGQLQGIAHCLLVVILLGISFALWLAMKEGLI